MSVGAPSGFQDAGPVAALLADGRRLHLQHGPIDLVIEANGPSDEVSAAYHQARVRFQTVLRELVDELPVLRLPVNLGAGVSGTVALRMRAATSPYAGDFITPMAAVAGSVADEILASMVAGRALSRAYVNNGGDIALYLGAGERYVAALVANPADGRIAGRASVSAADPIRGIATSGRHGRSHSLGIADAVTVLAKTAAAADAAATMIANAVDLPGSARVERAPARELYPDSDLGDRLVTVGVEHLEAIEIDTALEAGCRRARDLHALGLINAAFLALGDASRVLGDAMKLERQALEPRLEKTG
jgi:uncharacterized protein